MRTGSVISRKTTLKYTDQIILEFLYTHTPHIIYTHKHTTHTPHHTHTPCTHIKQTPHQTLHISHTHIYIHTSHSTSDTHDTLHITYTEICTHIHKHTRSYSHKHIPHTPHTCQHTYTHNHIHTHTPHTSYHTYTQIEHYLFLSQQILKHI